MRHELFYRVLFAKKFFRRKEAIMLPDAIFLNVHMYGVMIAVGLLCAFGVLFFYSKRLNVTSNFVDFIFYVAVGAIVLGFGAATLVQAFYNWLENPDAGFKIGEGFTFLGGLIGGAAVFLTLYFAFRKKFNNGLWQIMPAIPCAIYIAHGFGRIGCFFAGCCYGIKNDTFGVKFPNIADKVLPTQLYEAAFLFIMFGITSYLVLKKKFKYNLSLYLVAYGVFRFLIEFIRGDDRGKFIGALSPSQFWSIGMVLLGIGLFCAAKFWFYKKIADPEKIYKTDEQLAAEKEEKSAKRDLK